MRLGRQQDSASGEALWFGPLEPLVCLMQVALTAYQILERLYRQSVPDDAAPSLVYVYRVSPGQFADIRRLGLGGLFRQVKRVHV